MGSIDKARSGDAALPRRAHPLAAASPGVLEHVHRARRAEAFAREGRHASAERLLRDVAGALTRRKAWEPAAAALVSLGRLLLERGRAVDAERALTEARAAAVAGASCGLSTDATVWLVAARTDAGRLADAESLALEAQAAAPSPAQQAWAGCALARVCLWQGRIEAALAHAGSLTAAESVVEGPADDAVAAWMHAVRVRALLVARQLFEAGQWARRDAARWHASPDPLVHVLVGTTRLRVLCAAGDLEGAGRCLAEVAAHARLARTPLRLARAELVWVEALRRAGLAAEAARAAEQLHRRKQGAPPLLRAAIERAARPAHAAQARHDGGTTRASLDTAGQADHATIRWLRDVLDEDGDALALRRALAFVAEATGADRLDVTAPGGAPVASVVRHARSALDPAAGRRVFESGAACRLATRTGGHAAGVPIRLGGELCAALTAGWTRRVAPDAGAIAWLELAAALVAPRLEPGIRVPATSTAPLLPELGGASAATEALRRAVSRAAPAPFAVLIEGESGVGKELLARAIHALSPRGPRRFCDLNCAALPDDLVESELFGHAKGAFTGAVGERAGLFEEATGGTLFLDEVTELSPRAQAKLLRVLQQQEVRRLGESTSRAVDVRIVSAANRVVSSEAALGRFRQDLLYRLDVIHIHVPPLRERIDDIPLLAERFWRAAASRVGSRARLTHGVIRALVRYDWPGNVRELQNVMAALAVSAPARGGVVASMLPRHLAGRGTGAGAETLGAARAAFERQFVRAALARAAGRRADAARELGITRQGLLKLMARLGLGGDLLRPDGGAPRGEDGNPAGET